MSEVEGCCLFCNDSKCKYRCPNTEDCKNIDFDGNCSVQGCLKILREVTEDVD